MILATVIEQKGVRCHRVWLIEGRCEKFRQVEDGQCEKVQS